MSTIQSSAVLVRHGIRYNPLLPANFVTDLRTLSPEETLLHFVHLLRRRYQAVLAHSSGHRQRAFFLRGQLSSLALAEAFLRLGVCCVSQDEPLHVAVVGPTQAGKSSIANCLLQTELARVSPLAGYTVHPQGFALGLGQRETGWVDDYFAGFRRLPQEQLPHDRYDCFAFTVLAGTQEHPLAPMVVWDTPDFDSIDAEGYREGVLRTCALADVLLLVVSKDKYADQSVWDLLQLLAPLGQPTVICLNKVAEESRALLERSVADRWTALRGGSVPLIVSLLYRNDWGPALWQAAEGPAAMLTKALQQAASQVRPAKHMERARALLSAHWDAWLRPIRDEQEGQEVWRLQVDGAVEEAIAIYQRDYLDHPQHYETFQRALAEMLSLLEIPGLAKPLHLARRVVTWPVRHLVKLGRKRGGKTAGNEALVLERIVEHMLLRLAEQTLVRREQDDDLSGWWADLARHLQDERETQRRDCLTAVQDYQAAFNVEIEQAAQRLLERLREHPAVLNSLRATRVTTDAAAVALAFHTGGIALHDLVLAPAMLSVTSLLMEGALGRYVQRVEAELKQRQKDAVGRLLRVLAEKHWLPLPERLQSPDRFHISPATVAAAEACLGR